MTAPTLFPNQPDGPPSCLSRIAPVAVAAIALIFFASCEAPTLKDAEEQSSPEPATPQTAPSGTDASQTAVKESLSATDPNGSPSPATPADSRDTTRSPGPEKEASDLLSGDGLNRELPPGEELEPHLRVYWNEEKAIVVEGAISSRFQRDEIIQLLDEAFSGTRIEDRLELDYDRIPIGWGNRVALQFLVPFLSTIENGYVEYEMGIITMSGKGSRVDSDYFQHLAIDVFTGPYSRDIVNQISE